MPDQPLIVVQRGGKGDGEEKSLAKMMMMQQMMGAISGLGQSFQDYKAKQEEKKLNAIEAVISGRMTPEQAKEVFGVAVPGGIEPGQEAIAKREIARLQAKAARGETLTESESAQVGITKPAPSGAEIKLGEADVAARTHAADVGAGAQIHAADVGAEAEHARIAQMPEERASRERVADVEARSRSETETRRQEAEERQREFDKKQANRVERFKAYDRKRETKWNLLSARETRQAEREKLDLQFKAATYKTAVDFARQMDQDSTESLIKLAQMSKDEKADPEMRNMASAQLMQIVLDAHPEMRPYFEEKAGKRGWFWNTFLNNVMHERSEIQRKKLKTPAGDSATFSTAPSSPLKGASPTAPTGGAAGGVMTTDDIRRSLGR